MPCFIHPFNGIEAFLSENAYQYSTIFFDRRKEES
jgi:hypothetical protein